jgi:surface protein
LTYPTHFKILKIPLTGIGNKFKTTTFTLYLQNYFTQNFTLRMKNILLIIVLAYSSQSIIAQNFITRWNMATASSGATQLSFGVGTVGVVNYTWTTVPASTSGSGTFTGSTATITGLPANVIIRLSIAPTNFRKIQIHDGSDRNKLTQVEQWGSTLWNDMSYAFSGCSNLQVTATDIPNLAGVTSMAAMFRYCTSLNSPLNIGTWNTATVTNMAYMFNYSTAFNQPIGAWNTSAVTDMEGMFIEATAFNQSIGAWNTAAVTNMYYMFYYATAFNQPIGLWNTSAVIYMQNMFYNATAFNQPIGLWNTSAVVFMQNMFSYASAFNQPIGTWNTTEVENMTSMFSYATAFNQPLGAWNTTEVGNMDYMFRGATAFNQSLGTWIIPLYSTSMLDNCGMSCANYTATLIGWNNNPLTVTAVSFSAQGITYGNAASAARANLDLAGSGGKNWTISDGGLVASSSSVSLPSLTPLVCANTAITNITHTTTGASGIGTAQGLPLGLIATWASNMITISGTPSTVGVFNYCIPLIGGCSVATGTITVQSNKTVSLPSSTPTICYSSAITNITHTSTGATGIGAATNLPLGLIATWVSNTITISGHSFSKWYFQLFYSTYWRMWNVECQWNNYRSASFNLHK